MYTNRRKFIRSASALGATSLILPQWACTGSSSTNTTQDAGEAEAPTTTPSLAAFGLQLYTLRDLLPDDPKGILKQVSEMGYQQVEGYEGDMGMFWGMSHTDFKAYMDELGYGLRGQPL